MRRFSVARDDLNAAKLYNCMGASFVLYYADPEGDACAIRTDADVQEMLRLSAGANLIKLSANMANTCAVRPHVQSACNMACNAASTAAVEAKKVAEEAIVLGVRGVSYAQDQWVRIQSPEPAKEEPEKQPFLKKAAEEAIVLGVRGYSYASDQIGRLYPPAPEAVPLKEAPAVASSVEVATTVEVPVQPQLVAPPVEAPAKPVERPSSMMEQRLAELASMGFTDRMLNATLLVQNNFDVSACVAVLLDG